MTSKLQLSYEAAAANAERVAHGYTRLIKQAEDMGMGTHPAVPLLQQRRDAMRQKAGFLYTAALGEFNRNRKVA